MKDIEKLLKDHRKLIEAEASKNAQFVPLSVAEVEAYKIAREAAHSFDETQGIKFSTFLTNSLKKLSRLSTQYGNAARVPENKQYKINKINQAETHLHEELGRAPSVGELADATGFGISLVGNLLKSRKKEVNMNNLAYTPVFVENTKLDDWVHFVYHDLPVRDKLIFEHKTGFGGKEVLENDAIAKKLGISSSTIAHRVKIISDKINEKET